MQMAQGTRVWCRHRQRVGSSGIQILNAHTDGHAFLMQAITEYCKDDKRPSRYSRRMSFDLVLRSSMPNSFQISASTDP